MRAVDTNLLVRLLARDDAPQVDAAEKFVEQGAWVSHLVLAETLWVLDAVYGRAPEQLATALDMLLNHKNLTLQDADVVASALAQFRARPVSGFLGLPGAGNRAQGRSLATGHIRQEPRQTGRCTRPVEEPHRRQKMADEVASIRKTYDLKPLG